MRFIRSITSEGGLLKNAAFLTVADAATKGATGLLALLIARYLGPALFGQYAIASAVGGLFIMATAIGFEQELTRRGGIDRDAIPAALRLNFTALLLSSGIATAALALFLAIGPYSRFVVFLTLLLWVALVLGRFHFSFRYLSLLRQRAGVAAVIQSGSTALLLAATVVALARGDGLVTIVGIQVVVAIATLAAWVWWLPAGGLGTAPVTLPSLRGFVRRSLPYGISNLIWIAYFNFDAFMLSLMRSESEVGLYAGVFRIVAIAYIVGFAVSNSITPELFRSYSADRSRYGRLARRLVGGLFAISVVVAGSLFLLAEPLVTLVIGPEYAHGVLVMQILSAAAFFRLLNFGLSDLLTTSDRQTRRVRLESLLLTANIVMNLVLIPRFGAEGAALATLAAEAVLLLGVLWSCLRARLLSP